MMAALEESLQTTPAVTFAALNCAKECRPIQNKNGNKDLIWEMRQKRIMSLQFTGFAQKSAGFFPSGSIWS